MPGGLDTLAIVGFVVARGQQRIEQKATPRRLMLVAPGVTKLLIHRAVRHPINGFGVIWDRASEYQ